LLPLHASPEAVQKFATPPFALPMQQRCAAPPHAPTPTPHVPAVQVPSDPPHEVPVVLHDPPAQHDPVPVQASFAQHA